MAIIELTDSSFQAFKRKELTVGVFLDLRKTFDTAIDAIFLHTLEFSGIRDTPLNWLQSYLTDFSLSKSISPNCCHN